MTGMAIGIRSHPVPGTLPRTTRVCYPRNKLEEDPLMSANPLSRTSSRFSFLLCCAALLVFVLGVRRTCAQVNTGELLGTGTDSNAGVVQNACVTVTNLETQETRQAHTNASGEYVVTLRPARLYSVTVSSTTFKKFVQSEIALRAGNRRCTDAVMTPGENSQRHEVNTGPT